MFTYQTVCFELKERHNSDFWQTPAIQNTQFFERMVTKVQWSRHVNDKNLPGDIHCFVIV